ncbi:MAG: MMPL family transporter [Candidatus Hydrogenedens sp.]|nr:MMPL family transporter [Candidatus Hydrogenedens sp.]
MQEEHEARGPVRFAIDHPWGVIGLSVGTALLLVALVVLPLVAPTAVPFLSPVQVDTDPENMLDAHEPVRVFHNERKETLSLYDMIVVGVVNETHPQGVFNVETLGQVYELTEFAKTLHGEAIGLDDPDAGVVEIDLIAPSTVDNIAPGGPGVVQFEWLMAKPPQTDAEALAIRDKALRMPFLDGTLISEDGKAVAIYVPITDKHLSYRIANKLQEKIDSFPEGADFHITGLPVAEDTFGVEMFIQMAISAPAAMLVVFLLMLYFFRRLALVLSPLIVALLSVIITMGALVVTGNTIHIMSSMIPIFIMPISVLDSVHILSEYFEEYGRRRDRRAAIERVMTHLFTPMLYTSLTTFAGFISLALTPIPPVQVFGVFIAFGVMVAWFLTITFVPAFIMLLPARTFENFGAAHADEHAAGLLPRMLAGAARFTNRRARLVLLGTIALAALAVAGIFQININDNPIRWFHASHPIRVADRVLNEHFGGTYMAYLNFDGNAEPQPLDVFLPGFEQRYQTLAEEEALPEDVRAAFRGLMDDAKSNAANHEQFLDALAESSGAARDDAPDATYDAWNVVARFVTDEQSRRQVFKQPEALEYMAKIQAHLQENPVVGKSNSLADLVRTVHRELFEGAPEAYRIPESNRAVAQCIITYESSHRPHDLWHFVTPDFRQSSVWIQLRSGDNQDMAAVAKDVEQFVAQNPPPMAMKLEWFGLTYINVVWQEKMVSGMLMSFLGSFLVVFAMMVVLFRSALWALVSMIPLTITIGLIYGVIGFAGRDYDMPIAVLSSLTLGLAVDFAIHFLARARDLYETERDWPATNLRLFGEPARAIFRNVIVIAVGFLPLLLAPLVPYQTVGLFMAAILFTSGAATLIIVPALIRVLQPLLFPERVPVARACRFGSLGMLGAAIYGALWVNVQPFLHNPHAEWLIGFAIFLPLWLAVSFVLSRRGACRVYTTAETTAAPANGAREK